MSPAITTSKQAGTEQDVASLTLKALREIDSLLQGNRSDREYLKSLTEVLGSELDPQQNYNWRGLTPAAIDMYVRAAEAAHKKEVSTYEELKSGTEHIVEMMLKSEKKDELESVYEFLKTMHRLLLEMRHASAQVRTGRHSSRR